MKKLARSSIGYSRRFCGDHRDGGRATVNGGGKILVSHLARSIGQPTDTKTLVREQHTHTIEMNGWKKWGDREKKAVAPYQKGN